MFGHYRMRMGAITTPQERQAIAEHARTALRGDAGLGRPLTPADRIKAQFAARFQLPFDVQTLLAENESLRQEQRGGGM